LLRSELGIATFRDLLEYYPYRYYDRTKFTKAKDLSPEQEYVQLVGTIVNLSEEGEGPKRRLTATFYDETGRLELIWFQGRAGVRKSLVEGNQYVVFGKLSFFNGLPNIAHPEVESAVNAPTVAGMQPMYSSTQKLVNRGITNRSFARLTLALFLQIKPQDIPEILPAEIMSKMGFCSRFEALKWIHFPQSDEQLQAATFRLKWEELFLSQLSVAKVRQQHTIQQGWLFTQVGNNFNNFYNEQLPFPLTGAQKRVVKEIRIDTATGKQMNRLLQGDVGSGKTIVAVLSMLIAMDNGFQACIMAPT
jgi:ATP-dependent DNA helicase RecG